MKNKQVILKNKEKILSRAVQRVKTEEKIVLKPEEITPLKAWRDSQIYKLRSKLVLS